MPDRHPRSAIILAAGNGHRMGRLTIDCPKCMLEVGGRAVIEWQVASLEACGVKDVTVVIGYRGSRIATGLGDRVRYVENPRYRETNSLYSLWLARHRLAGGALVLNGDVLAPTPLIDRLLRAPAEDAVLVDPTKALGPEEMKVKLWCDLVVDFGKELAPAEADGENVGIVKFGRKGARQLIACLDALVASGHEQAWAPRAFQELARKWPLRAVLTDGLPWMELDFPDDLERARVRWHSSWLATRCMKRRAVNRFGLPRSTRAALRSRTKRETIRRQPKAVARLLHPRPWEAGF